MIITYNNWNIIKQEDIKQSYLKKIFKLSAEFMTQLFFIGLMVNIRYHWLWKEQLLKLLYDDPDLLLENSFDNFSALLCFFCLVWLKDFLHKFKYYFDF